MALLFLLFHQRLCGPLANSQFHHRPDPTVQLNTPLEAAYHKADAAIEGIIDCSRRPEPKLVASFLKSRSASVEERTVKNLGVCCGEACHALLEEDEPFESAQ